MLCVEGWGGGVGVQLVAPRLIWCYVFILFNVLWHVGARFQTHTAIKILNNVGFKKKKKKNKSTWFLHFKSQPLSHSCTADQGRWVRLGGGGLWGLRPTFGSLHLNDSVFLYRLNVILILCTFPLRPFVGMWIVVKYLSYANFTQCKPLNQTQCGLKSTLFLSLRVFFVLTIVIQTINNMKKEAE